MTYVCLSPHHRRPSTPHASGNYTQQHATELLQQPQLDQQQAAGCSRCLMR